MDVIRIKGEVENYEDNEEVEEDSGFIGQACKKKGPAVNPFALVSGAQLGERCKG